MIPYGVSPSRETWIAIPTGFVVFENAEYNPNGTEYIRLVNKDGGEVTYWQLDVTLVPEYRKFADDVSFPEGIQFDAIPVKLYQRKNRILFAFGVIAVWILLNLCLPGAIISALLMGNRKFPIKLTEEEQENFTISAIKISAFFWILAVVLWFVLY